jgi:uncharacterized protein YndB with AHSA1/START domain
MPPTNNPARETTSEELAPLRLSRLLHARRETVFRAWSRAEHVSRWFAPETFTIPDATVEMRVGGAFKLTMRSPAGEEHRLRGTFIEIVPQTRLVIDMQVADTAGNDLFRAYTEIGFADALGGTQLDIVQTYTMLDPSKAWMVKGAPEGWRSTLENLEREAVRMQGGGEIGERSVVHATFRIERSYDAPAARVWRALTDQTAKTKWFGGPPGKWELIERHMDVRPGGTERLKGRWESGTVSTFDAVYHDVIANQRLVYSYQMHLGDRKISVSLATLQLRVANGRTTLIVTEQGAFLDGYDDAGSREQGTGQLLDALGASLAD